MMVMLEYNSNYIMVEGMQDQMMGKMVQAYQMMLNKLNGQGLYPKQHILDEMY